MAATTNTTYPKESFVAANPSVQNGGGMNSYSVIQVTKGVVNQIDAHPSLNPDAAANSGVYTLLSGLNQEQRQEFLQESQNISQTSHQLFRNGWNIYGSDNDMTSPNVWNGVYNDPNKTSATGLATHPDQQTSSSSTSSSADVQTQGQTFRQQHPLAAKVGDKVIDAGTDAMEGEIDVDIGEAAVAAAPETGGLSLLVGFAAAGVNHLFWDYTRDKLHGSFDDPSLGNAGPAGVLSTAGWVRSWL